jgi:hypothetical protein
MSVQFRTFIEKPENERPRGMLLPEGFITRTNVPREVTPLTMASNVSPILLLIATAAIRFDISRSTFRAASSFNVQLSAIAASCSSE